MYTDEKRPDGEIIYVQEVTDLEAAQPKPQRSCFRRVLRVFLTLCLIGWLANAFTPMPHCARKNKANHGVERIFDKPKTDYSFDKNIKDFHIIQGSLSKIPSLTKVYGKVLLAADDKADDISVKFDINVSDDGLWDKIKIRPGKHGIWFAADSVSLIRQWVNVTALVTFPSADDYNLRSLEVETSALNIRLLESFTTRIKKTKLETVSGNITSYGGRKDVEMSPYLAAKSVSGNIYGRFGLGKALALKTVSGNIGVNITDAPLDGVKAKLSTETVSGENRLQFADVLHARPLYSKHVSVGGNIFIDYPEQWQGHMKATSVSGKIRFAGEGVQITKKENNPGSRLLKGLKGDGDAYAFLHSTAGNINLAFPGSSAKDPKDGDGDGIGFWY